MAWLRSSCSLRRVVARGGERCSGPVPRRYRRERRYPDAARCKTAGLRIYHTANGTVWGAPVRLNNGEVGPISLQNVQASVNVADMDLSLLGMSFFSRWSSYEVTRGTLTLRP